MTFEEACEKLNGCKHLYLETFGHGDRDSQFRMEIVAARAQATVPAPSSGNAALDNIFGPGAPIEPDSGSAHFTIVFERYTAISIINESYAEGDTEKTPGIVDKTNKNIRSYEKSHFRDYMSAVTFATDNHPGPQKHFEISCLNHIINVVCENDPIITITTLGEISAARTS